MAKDLVGGSAAVFKTLGASNHTDAERQREDYYATEPKATDEMPDMSRIAITQDVSIVKRDRVNYTEEEKMRMALELIATLRRLRGLTQEQLAQEAGLQRTHVNRIEAGKYAVTIDVMQAIAKVLGMTVDLIDPALQDLAPLRKLNTYK